MRGGDAQPVKVFQGDEQPIGGSVFPVHAEAEAGNGDADLGGAEVAVDKLGVVEQVQQLLGLGRAGLRQLGHARAGCPGDGKFGGDKEAVDEDE